MSDEEIIRPSVSRWTKLAAGAAHVLRKRTGIYLGLCIAVALMGYALSLLFPIVSLVLLIKIGVALQETGLSAISGQLLNLGLLAFGTTISISLWRLRVGDPVGESVTEQQVPELFALVDEMRTAFQAPIITDIHLAEDARLRVERIPRTGYPFFFRHVLVAGLPTLQCLSLDQFKCLLATCLGELSAVRTDAAGWIGQLARTWQHYRVAVAGQWQPAALLYRAFLSWYAPLLSALAEQLDTGHRLRRDHYALEVASDDLVADMLAGEVIMSRFLQEHYWPTVYRTAEHSATPNFKAFRSLEAVFHRRVTNELVQNWVREAFVGKWCSDERDPGLKARLREIGHADIHYQPPQGQAAAIPLFGASYQWIIDRCDARWADEHREEWRLLHEKSQRQYDRLEMLRGVLQRHGLQGEDAMAYAALVKRYGTQDEAREAYRTILDLNPNDARINFGVGKYLLSCKDARGVKLLEHAMTLDKRYVNPACRLISGFVVNHRLQDTVRNYIDNDKDEAGAA